MLQSVTLSTEYFAQALNGWGAYTATLTDDATGEVVFQVRRRDEEVAVGDCVTWVKANAVTLNDLTGLVDPD